MIKTTADIIAAINASQNVIVCGHIRPDGDCVSSALAMCRICQKLGKKAVAVCDADKPSSFGFLPGYDGFCKPENIHYDLFIAVDCATKKRLGEYAATLERAKYSIDVDHHPTNERYAKLNYVDADAASTCSIIYELFRDTGLIDVDIAKMLYTGLSTDTGHFMHGNTTKRVFDIAGELCNYGFDIGKLNHDIYCNKSMKRIKLTSRALDSIKLFCDGRVALMTIMLDDLDACGCVSEDTEGLIDFVSGIEGVEVAISMCEQPGGIFRVSFRSTEADVAAAAGRFGGGGHKLAAGCIINGNRYDVAEKVTSAAAAALGAK